MTRTGSQAVIEQLLADGLDVMFGNPGTVEQGLLDEIARYPAMRYVLTLHETVAVMAADAHARARRKPSLVQIHSTPGLGNAVGALYQAMRGHSPLVIIGGDAGIRYQAMDAQMAGNLVGIAAPVTKWATMVMHPDSLLRVLRRAVKIAATPPMGPVYVCLPMDILDAAVNEQARPALVPSTRVVPEPEVIERIATGLLGATDPMIFCGDGVAFSGAEAALTEVAELSGAEVWAVDAGEVNMAPEHPLYRGMTGHMFGEDSDKITERGDYILIVGTYMLPEVFPTLAPVFKADARVVHIDLNAYEIGKNHRVDEGYVADPKLTLLAVAAAMKARRNDAQATDADKRINQLAASKRQDKERKLAADAELRGRSPLHFESFMEVLGPRLPQHVVVFDEALTNSPAVTRYLPEMRPGAFFQTRGGSLGVGAAGGIGLGIAFPGRPVWVFAGDGATMYTVQALWSAVRHRLNVKFVICSNGSYRLLQANIMQYWKEREIPPHDFPLPFDLSNPPLEFAPMARSMGMPGLIVAQANDIQGVVEEALTYDGPMLIDVKIEGTVQPHLIGVKCGQ